MLSFPCAGWASLVPPPPLIDNCPVWNKLAQLRRLTCLLRHFMHLKFETVAKWGGVEWDGLMEGANAPAIAQSICAPAAETRRTINGSLTVQLKLTFFSAFPISFRSSSYFLLNKYTLYIVGAPAPEHPRPPLARSTCFAIRALCSFFISLNFLHSLKVFHFLFMPPACAACLPAFCTYFTLHCSFCRPRVAQC